MVGHGWRGAVRGNIGIIAPYGDVVHVRYRGGFATVIVDRQGHRVRPNHAVGIGHHGERTTTRHLTIAKVPRVRRDVEIGARRKRGEHNIGGCLHARRIGRKRTLQRTGLLLVGAHVHTVAGATDTGVAGKVDGARHPGLVGAGIYGRAGQKLVVGGSGVHERRRRDIANTGGLGTGGRVSKRAAPGVVGDARQARAGLVVQHDRVPHGTAVDAAARAGRRTAA